MLASNTTPFAALGFEMAHRDGPSMAVVAVRGRFRLTGEGQLELAGDQALVLSDEFEGPPPTTPLMRVSDLVPWRPRADLTILGHAYAPHGEAAADWTVGVRIGSFRRLVRVCGPRSWIPDHKAPGTNWKLEAPLSVQWIALDPRNAAGGRVFGDETGALNARNPLGTGELDADLTRQGCPYPAPLLEDPDYRLSSPFQAYPPCGPWPLPPWWEDRLRYAGTFGDQWLRNRHPRLPADFDYRFYQVAHPDYILPGFLRGDELIELAGLTPGGGRLDFRLPGVRPIASWQWIDGREVVGRLELDGLHLDLRGNPPWRVDLTWRNWAVICPRFFKVDLALSDIAATAALPGSGEDGLSLASAAEAGT